MLRKRFISVSICALAYAIISFECESLEADDRELRHHISRVTADAKQVREAAIKAITVTKDVRMAEFFDAYQSGQIYQWQDKLIFCPKIEGNVATLFDVLSREPVLDGDQRITVPKSDLKMVSPRRTERRLIVTAIRVLQLYSHDREQRLGAVRKLGDSRSTEFVKDLNAVTENDADSKVRHTARESVALIRLHDTKQPTADRLAAARELGKLCSARAVPLLRDLLKDQDETGAKQQVKHDTRTVFRQALDRIESYQQRIRILSYVFSGLSLGSVLILMALGLSIIFGQMGVINMAHGELMMIGAYATFEMQRLFGHSLPDAPNNWFFVIALPTAFFSAALIGYLIEVLVVRHLYGRPLETLLATWGIGLILIQAVRLRYGDNIGVNSPTWLVGSFEVFQDFHMPFNRCFIMVLCAFCVALAYWIMNHSRPGLLVRATVQNREMAAALGVNTRRTDAYTFAFGAGLAGIAGYALTLVGGVTPDMGQNYIVDSFLVVVTGGVGELAGAVWAGLGLGTLNKFLEPYSGTIWGKVIILCAVIAFIQWRPAGLFPPKGRSADV